MQTMQHYYSRSSSNGGGGVTPDIVAGMPSSSVDFRPATPAYHSYAPSSAPDAAATAQPYHHHSQHHQQQHHQHHNHHPQTAHPQQHHSHHPQPAGTPTYALPLPSPSPLATHGPMSRSSVDQSPRPASAIDRAPPYAAASTAPQSPYGLQHNMHTYSQPYGGIASQPDHAPNLMAAVGYGSGISGRGYSGGAFDGGYRLAGGFNPFPTTHFGQQQQQQQHPQPQHPHASIHAYDDVGGNAGDMMYTHQQLRHQQNHHHHRLHNHVNHNHPQNAQHMHPNTNASFYGPNQQQQQQQPPHQQQQHPHLLPQHNPHPLQSGSPATNSSMSRSADAYVGFTENGSDEAPAYPPQQHPPYSGHHFHQNTPLPLASTPYFAPNDNTPPSNTTSSMSTSGTTTSGTATAATVPHQQPPAPTPPSPPPPPLATSPPSPPPPPSSSSGASREFYGADAVVVRNSSASSPVQSPPTTAGSPPPIDAVPQVGRSGHTTTGNSRADAGEADNGDGGCGSESSAQNRTDVTAIQQTAFVRAQQGETETTTKATTAAALSIMRPCDRTEGDGGSAGAAGGTGGTLRATAAALKHGSIASSRGVDDMVEVTNNYPTPPPSAVPTFYHHATADQQFHDAYSEPKSRWHNGREKNLSKMAAMNRKLEKDTFYGSSSPMYETDRAYATNLNHPFGQRNYLTSRAVPPSSPYMVDPMLAGPYFHAPSHHHQHHHYAHHPYARYGGIHHQHQQQQQHHLHHSGGAYARAHPQQMPPTMHHHLPWAATGQMASRGATPEWGAYGGPYSTYRRQAFQTAVRQSSPVPETVRKGRVGRPSAKEMQHRANLQSGVFESDVIPNKKKRKAKAEVEKEVPPKTPQVEAKSVTPLPGFLQAFGSTEIGRFSEMFFNAPDSPLDPATTTLGIDFEPDNMMSPQPFSGDICDGLDGSNFYVPSGSSSVHSMNAESYTSTGSPASSIGYFGDARSIEY